MGGSGFPSKIMKGEIAITVSKTIASEFNTFLLT